MARAHRWSGLALIGAGLVLAAAPTTQADEIQLRAGGRISGIVVEKTERTVTIETGPGRVTLPLSLVDKVVSSRSVIEIWQERSNALAGSDAQGWAELARWAEAQSLVTQARAAWQRVLTVNPQSAEANAALGRVLMDGTWVARDDAYRAQGLVPFEGRWVSPAEQEALLRQNAADSAAARSQREAETRMREAEARAQEAEARARETEASYSGGSVPISVGYGCSGYGCGGYGVGGYGVSGSGRGSRGHVEHHGDHDRPRPEIRPSPAMPPPPARTPPSVAPTRPPDTSAAARPSGVPDTRHRRP